MKMIQAVVRTEKFRDVEQAMEKAGFSSLTTTMVMGRGQQKGIQVGSTHYNILPKQMIWLVINDDEVEKAVDVITASAETGSIGDGKIFVLDIVNAIRIRTKESGVGVL